MLWVGPAGEFPIRARWPCLQRDYSIITISVRQHAALGQRSLGAGGFFVIGRNGLFLAKSNAGEEYIEVLLIIPPYLISFIYVFSYDMP